MKPPLKPSSMFFLLVPFFISINIPTSVGADDDQFTNCSNSFSCGSISDLKYPFWGGNRADYCGLPDFELKCQGSIPQIIIDSITYRILHLDLSEQGLTAAREDYMENICPSVYKNNTFGPSTFNYVGELLNVTFLYDCPGSTYFPKNQFLGQNCNRVDGTNTYVYYVLQSVYIRNCKSVILPVIKDLAQAIMTNQIQAALHDGFGLQWMVNDEQCVTCGRSGGECGYNKTERQFSCFCKDGPHKTSCSDGSSYEPKETDGSPYEPKEKDGSSSGNPLSFFKALFLKMHPLHLSIFVSFFFITITLYRIPRCFGADDEKYTKSSSPILESEASFLETNSTVENLKVAIVNGFGSEWNENDTLCDDCSNSGGHCHYDPISGEFTCYCRDGYSLSTCGSKKKTLSPGTRAGIGVGVAAAVCILLGCCVYFMVKRRRIIAERSKSKDHLMPPSSRGAATSTTNMSQSVPSYTTSNSESVKNSFYFGVQVFSYAELEVATKNFDPSRELGNGGFGTVYYGNLKDGRAVAVKRLYESNLKRVEQFKNEVEILARLRHNNLVALYGCTSRHSRELLLVYEYISNGTVADHLHGKRAKSALLPWPIRLNIAVETAEALAYLHASEIIHRDVKTNNILLDNNFCVKVADFGLSRLFPNDVTHVSTAPQGTPGYVDPEYYQCYQLTNKSDVYSFGVVLVELISSLEAVDISRHRHEINLASLAVNKIQNHALHELVDPYLGFEKDNAIRQMTTAVAELAFRCLQQEREMRPSMDEVLEVLRGIQNEEYGGKKAEVMNIIRTDEIILLKNVSSPLSPDSVADKWVSSSTTSNSS